MSEYIIEKKKVLPRFENMIKEWGGNTSIQFPIRAKGFLDKKSLSWPFKNLLMSMMPSDLCSRRAMTENIITASSKH